MTIRLRLHAWLRKTLRGIIVVIAAVVVFWSGTRVGDATLAPSARHRWFFYGIVAVIFSVGLPLWEQLRAERATFQARVALRVAVNDALDPIVLALGRISSASRKERPGLQQQIIPMVLNSAAELLDPERVRACWFEYRDGPPRSLEPVCHAGRAGEPKTIFKEGTQEGDGVLSLIAEKRALVCSDVDRRPPQGWRAENHADDYKCFIVVPVIAGAVAYGMLTVDAPKPGVLAKADVPLLRLLAGLLACALASGAS